MSHWQEPTGVVVGGSEPMTALTDPSVWPTTSASDLLPYLDLITYLPDDILTKVDRATMAVSLEGRIPLLDHRVVEMSWRVPASLKVRSGGGKVVLRGLLGRYVPSHLFERPKMGFGVPIDTWLRGPLRDWAESLLDPNRLRREGYLAVAPIRTQWDDFVGGGSGHHALIWDVLMFQAWLENASRVAL